MTYRERRERKAERYREWADKRDKKSAAAFGTADRISSFIPMGQPILVGHHSEKRHRRDLDRIDSGMRNGIEHAKKADSFRSRADNIEAAADRAIYDDDPDAIERLEEKLAKLEGERERNKTFNKTHAFIGESRWDRNGKVGKIIGKRTGFVTVEYQDGTTEEAPRARVHPALSSYVASNLSGVIGNTRKRLEYLKKNRDNDAVRETREAGGATIAKNANGWLEVAFPEKPDREVLDELRAAGFYWDRKRCCWFGHPDKLPQRYAADKEAAAL